MAKSRESREREAGDEAPSESRTGLREALLAAAVQMVKDEGVDAISVREVARRAGVSSGAPFRHFRDRNALLAAVAEDGFVRLEATIAETIAAAPDDLVERLKSVGIASAIFAARHPAHYRVMHHPALALDPRIAALARRRHEALRALVLEGQSRGLVRNSDPELVALLCVSVVGGLARLFVDGGFEWPSDHARPLEEIEALVRSAIELFGLGILDDAARAQYAKSMPASVRGRARRTKKPAPEARGPSSAPRSARKRK